MGNDSSSFCKQKNKIESIYDDVSDDVGNNWWINWCDLQL
jgi:hypothetical protein